MCGAKKRQASRRDSGIVTSMLPELDRGLGFWDQTLVLIGQKLSHCCLANKQFQMVKVCINE